MLHRNARAIETAGAPGTKFLDDTLLALADAREIDALREEK